MINKCKQGVIVIVFYLLLTFNFICPANAHKAMIFAWVEGDVIYTESKFSGGRQVKNAPVEVYADNGNMLLEGKTDGNGEFSFKIPKKTKLKLVLLAGMGHQAEWIISAKEIEEAIHGQTGYLNTQNTDIIESGKNVRPMPVWKASTVEIQEVCEKALDKKLKPMQKMLRDIQMHRAHSIADILGGIGYIMGLVGIGTFFYCRREKRKTF